MDCNNNSVVNNCIVLNDQNEMISDRSISGIRPMYYSNNPDGRWNFPIEIQNKIRNELNSDWQDDLTDSCKRSKLINPYKFIPYKINSNEREICPFFPCICKNIKNINCISACCKFKYSKNSNVQEYRFKDGLEILDIPSTMMNTIEKRAKERLRKKNKSNPSNQQAQAQAQVNVQPIQIPHPIVLNAFQQQMFHPLFNQAPNVFPINQILVNGIQQNNGFNLNQLAEAHRNANRPDQLSDRKLNDN